MPVVVDASAVVAMAFGEPEGATLTAYLAGQTLIAPVLLDVEVANTALKKTKRHRDSAAAIAVSLNAVLSLPIDRVNVPAAEAFALAAATGLTTYDASYLWLALTYDAELVTLDDELARAAADDRRPRGI